MKYTILALSPICFIPTIAHAQPIIPNQDGTGTIVNQQGNQFNIQGGSRSSNNANLFHSFQEFNVNQGQTANFISTPAIKNILGRINGGNPSFINGIIQVTGGNSNLFLMNPAGIIFGAGANLNLPASFHVSTATGIGFDHNQWFQSIGNNDYQNLVGTPNKFIFANTQPGTIINQGNLYLTNGKSLSFLGGTVINAGQLSVPGGNITIAAVKGENIVKISQVGHLLSLELLPFTNISEVNQIEAVSLPKLLTGNQNNNQANTIKINEFGQVVLGNTGFAINDINQIAINTEKIDVSQSNYGSGGQINIIGNKVGLIGGEINASGYNQGGTVLIGGDWQGQGIVPNALKTYVSQDSLINADAVNNGNGGKVIIWSDDQTNFQGSITARGGINSGDGGLVEISGKKQLIFDGKVDVSAVNGLPGTVLFDPDNLTLEKSDSENDLVNNSEENATDDLDEQLSKPVSQSEATNVTKSEQSENTDEVKVKKETITDRKDVSESVVTKNENLSVDQEVIDPFVPDESNNVTVNSDNVNKLDVDKLDLDGNIELQANNDLTVNQAITTDKSLKLVAGRSIKINADIDTSKGNGNIGIFANNTDVDQTKRQTGPANIVQAENTILNAGAGDIVVEMGALGEVGEIKLGNLTTKGLIAIWGADANIHQVSANSLFRADKIKLDTLDGSGIGKSDLPLRIDSNYLEVATGSGGIFLQAIAPLIIGDVSDDLTGITTYDGGEINLKVDGDLTATESISSYLYLDEEDQNTLITRDISINATGNIKTKDINIKYTNADVGNIKIESTQGSIDTTLGNINIDSSGSSSIGNISIIAPDNIIIGSTSISSANGNIGMITIESKQGSIDARPLIALPVPTATPEPTDNITNDTAEGVIDYYGNIIINSQAGNIGDFSILANDDIKTGDIVIRSIEGNIGNIKIESTQGVIDISSGFITINAKNGDDVDININITDEYKDHISIRTEIPTPVPTPVPTPALTPTPNETSITEVAESKKNATDNNLNTIDNVFNAEGDINISNGTLYVGNQGSDIPITSSIKTDIKTNVTVIGVNNTENIQNIQGNVNSIDINNIKPRNIDINPIPEGVIKTLPPNSNISVEQVLTLLTNTPQTNNGGNIQPVNTNITLGNIINNIATRGNNDRGTINQNPVSTSRGAINNIPNNSIQTQPLLSPSAIPQQTNLNPIIIIPKSPINPISQVGNNLSSNQNIKINNPSPTTINTNTLTAPGNVNISIPRLGNPNVVLTPTNLSQLNNQDENLLDDQLGQSSQTLTTNNPVKIGSNFQSLEEENIQIILNNLEQETGTKATLIAINSYLDSVQIALYTANSQPVFKTIPISRQQLLQLADDFRNINNLNQNVSTKYLTEAQRLYQLLIQPIEDILQTNQTNTLLFLLDQGLGNFPIADLYDGQKFLAEKYRIIPYGIR